MQDISLQLIKSLNELLYDGRNSRSLQMIDLRTETPAKHQISNLRIFESNYCIPFLPMLYQLILKTRLDLMKSECPTQVPSTFAPYPRQDKEKCHQDMRKENIARMYMNKTLIEAKAIYQVLLLLQSTLITTTTAEQICSLIPLHLVTILRTLFIDVSDYTSHCLKFSAEIPIIYEELREITTTFTFKHILNRFNYFKVARFAYQLVEKEEYKT
jgi:hypothetical protein